MLGICGVLAVCCDDSMTTCRPHFEYMILHPSVVEITTTPVLPESERHASGHVFRPGPVWGCDRLVSRAKVIENQVMAISVISVSPDSSEDSIGTLARQVILFGTTIPDTTPVITPPTTQTDTTVIPDTPPSLPMQLAVRHSVDHYSLDSSSEASSYFHSDASSDSSLRHSLSDHSSPDLPSTFVRPSRKRRRSAMTSVPTLPPIAGALSPVRADLIPSPKRIRSPESATDLEDSFEPYVPKEVGLGVDVEDESSERFRSRGTDIEVDDDVERSDGMDIDPEIQAEIDECFAYADALRDRGIDARVVVEAVDREESETGARGPVEVIVERAILVHRIQVIEGVQREQGYRIVGVESTVTALTERVAELERDDRRLKGTASVESQRVDQLQRGMSRMQRELRQIRWFRFYDRVRVGRFEVCAMKHMGYRP
ncbi:hypothetical protein Tco_1075540 [Tanacetum coccineum]